MNLSRLLLPQQGVRCLTRLLSHTCRHQRYLFSPVCNTTNTIGLHPSILTVLRLPSLPVANHAVFRTITTTDKKKDSITIKADDQVEPEKEETWDDILKTHAVDEEHKEWVPYGYSATDIYEDKFMHHTTMFLLWVVVFFWGGFFVVMMPDFGDRHWIQREAYLELARRERDGLPPVDMNLIPPDRVLAYLPSEEQLKDYEIVI